MIITGFYAALLTVFLIWLSFRVINARQKNKVSIGTGGIAELEQHHAAHANFCQYVPMILILMAAAELGGAYALVVHGLGIVTVIGRLAHARGMTNTTGDFRMRILGMQLTFGALAVGAVVNIILAGLRLIG